MTLRREPVLPPLDGSVTVPEAIDFNWQHNADLPMFAYETDGSSKATEITFLEFGRACHRVAHLVRPRRAGPDREIVAFIALADTIVYQAVVVGLMTAGLVPFPISPRNTPAAIVHLLLKTSCHRLITTSATLSSLLDGVKTELAADFDLSIEEIPMLYQIYPRLGNETVDDPFERYPPPLMRPHMSDVALYLHSSGSTGFPKAIPQTYLILAHWAALPSLIQFRDHRPRVRVAAMMLPPFHTLGIYVQILYPMFGLVSLGVYPPQVTSSERTPMIPTPENIFRHTRCSESNSMVTIPALLQVWAQSPEAVDFLRTLHLVGYSGGAVAPKLGNFMIANGIKLHPGYGATEFGSPTYAIPRPGDENDWAYMEFSERCEVRWVPQGDGTFECQFLTTDTHSLAVENLPDVRGYATSDLFEPHPTKPYLWKIVGRIDDVVIHSSGEKTVPAPMEDIVLSSPYVMGTVIFGRAHDQPGILIEPKEQYAIDIADQTQFAKFRNTLWSVIEEANKVAPAFSRIFKEMILVTSKGKPLPRTGKGTVMRKLALKAYDNEIEKLYITVEESAKGEDVIPPFTWDHEGVCAWLLEQAADIDSGKAFDVSRDLFDQGFDRSVIPYNIYSNQSQFLWKSLSSTILRRRIADALRGSKDNSTIKAAENITQNTVYTYPSIEALTTFLVRLIANTVGNKGGKNATAEIEAMIEKYSADLESLPVPTSCAFSVPAGKVILLTGSTGNLGSQILAELLLDPSVERVYALNRAAKGSDSIFERHTERFVDKALDLELLRSDRLVFVEGDTSMLRLGLSDELYNEVSRSSRTTKKLQGLFNNFLFTRSQIRNSVTIIIHNAWRLNFNLSLMSFEPNVRGVRRLIDLARSVPHPELIRFMFTSSVASAQAWGQPEVPFPEEIVTDVAVSVGNGYGEGKYVSERILAKSGIQAASLRIGQVCGGLPNGAWATSDWLPILVKSSIALGALPHTTGFVSWLPMHAVSRTILDIAFSADQLPEVINLVHPRPVQWNGVIDGLRAILDEDERPLRIVPFQEWFSLLERRATNANDADIQAIPAVKLLEFFRAIIESDRAIAESGSHEVESGGLTKFATAKAQSLSQTMREVQPISTQDAEQPD
ncbi:putative NRPS-like protein biosynthetic cluster [Termitomyces sp. T32_za158]|nr:putative NRPS-like protein biosynthetic cluster [Termitomyces sp. T32_za158]